jgi:hypothetical protein
MVWGGSLADFELVKVAAGLGRTRRKNCRRAWANLRQKLPPGLG